MSIDHFTDLIVWQLANELRREIVAFTGTGPAARDFRFRDQIREAIASACRNSAEGFDRFRPGVFAGFLEFARGSLGEVQDCLIDAKNRAFIDEAQFNRLWLLSKRAIGANTNLTIYLKECAARGLEPWRHSDPAGHALPNGERGTPADPQRRRTRTPEERKPANPESTNCEPENQETGTKNQEPRTRNGERRTENREPRTLNREP